jgi:3-hydroxyisobutyrate dehydrogenase
MYYNFEIPVGKEGLMKAGFIGLGTLGKAITMRLLSQGVDLIVWNRTKEKALGLGVAIAESPQDLAGVCDTIILNLFDGNAVRSVVTGPKGLMQADLAGKLFIDTTTNHFDDAAAFHALFKERGAHYIEAPVLGSVVPASQGNLTVLVSGEAEAFQRARPYIEKFGKTVFYLGEPGLATKMKLINNLLLGAFMASIAEACVLGEAVGLSRETALDIFAAGAGNSMVLSAKKEKLNKLDFSVHFSSALIYKDLHYLQDLARRLRRPLFTGSIVKELFGMTFKTGKETLDFSGVYEVLKVL